MLQRHYNTFALERHTDEICARLGMRREEFRRRNALADGDIGATGQVFQGDVLGPMLERMEGLRAAEPVATHADGWLHGRATVMGTWFIFVGPSSATVHLNPDASATLVSAGVEIGSGSMVQAIPQIVADTLGIDPEEVVVRAADTDAAGFDLGVGGGRTTVSIGAASQRASEEVRSKVADAAAEMFEYSPDDVVLGDGKVQVAGAPSTAVALAEVVAFAQQRTGPISGSGSFTQPGVAAMPGCAAGHYIEALDLPVFAVHDCEGPTPDTWSCWPTEWSRTSAARSTRGRSGARSRAGWCRGWATRCTRR